MRVLALEAFDEGSDFRRDGTGLSAILARLGRQRGQAVAAIAEAPIQQRVHRDLAAGGMGDVVEAGAPWACSRSTPPRHSRTAPCSATASASPSTFSTREIGRASCRERV